MKKMMALLSIVLTVTSMLYACGGGGGGTSTGGIEGPSGTVALFATDAKMNDLSGFQQVNVTLDGVSLLSTDMDTTCDLLTTSTFLNLSNLSSTIQLLSVSSCPAAQFNRIHLVFDRSLTLMTGNESSTCTFTSFKDESNNPNILSCGANTCSLDINGAVNVLAGQPGKLSLDFVLKDFVVDDFPGPNCTVTMKVSPLNASDMNNREKNRGFKEAVTGNISSLDTTTKTFILEKGNRNFTVNYSGVTETGIDQLLQFAQNNNLKVQVKTSSIDLSDNTIAASAIFVKVEGTVSGLTAATFTLNGAPFTSITVDYSGAEMEGTPANGASVGVKLNGFDGTEYLAFEVEVETGLED